MPGPAHDYMGFVVTRDFIFTSGHVAASRGAANPLGLRRSGDGGQSWATLGFEGEAEFHLVAAGYLNNALYVYNPGPNSVMPRAGIYRMMGERLIGWRSAAARGLDRLLFAQRLAVRRVHRSPRELWRGHEPPPRLLQDRLAGALGM